MRHRAVCRCAIMGSMDNQYENIAGSGYEDPCIRAENEDDDGYDPYSDRRPEREPMFEADPWR